MNMLLNPKKSIAIYIRNGNLVSENRIIDGLEIHSTALGEKTRYLGVNFLNQIIFDEKEFLTSLEKNFQKLVTSPL